MQSVSCRVTVERRCALAPHGSSFRRRSFNIGAGSEECAGCYRRLWSRCCEVLVRAHPRTNHVAFPDCILLSPFKSIEQTLARDPSSVAGLGFLTAVEDTIKGTLATMYAGMPIAFVCIELTNEQHTAGTQSVSWQLLLITAITDVLSSRHHPH